MIVWKGLGIFALLIPVGLGLLFHWMIGDTAASIAALIGGVVVFLLGVSDLSVTDEERQQGIKTKIWHNTLFFLPMIVWGPVAIAFSIWMLVR